VLKTRILFLGLLLFGVSVLQAQNLLRRTVQFACTDCSATEALTKLSQQENIAILFPGTLFDGTTRLRISAQKYRLGPLLDQIAANVPHEIVVSDGQVLLRSKKEPVKRFTLSGYLRDAETGERLIGATIMDARRQGVVSNEFGFYSMLLESGEHLLRVSYIGYDVLEQKIQIWANQTRNFDLKTHNVLSEVTITAAVKAYDSLRL